jgi:hypothetical protein
MNMSIIYIILNMAAKLALIMLILTVKSKSWPWVLENRFANVSNIFVYNLYHKIS